MKQKININQICRIKIFYRSICKHFYYYIPKHFWNKKEGFYHTITLNGPELITPEEIETLGYYLVDGRTVFYKPHIEIYLSNGQEVVDWFETSEELERFITEYLKDIPLIII